jgi:hypothetical protein
MAFPKKLSKTAIRKLALQSSTPAEKAPPADDIASEQEEAPRAAKKSPALGQAQYTTPVDQLDWLGINRDNAFGNALDAVFRGYVGSKLNREVLHFLDLKIAEIEGYLATGKKVQVKRDRLDCFDSVNVLDFQLCKASFQTALVAHRDLRIEMLAGQAEPTSGPDLVRAARGPAFAGQK